jgi:hypothetical protein
MAIRDSQDLTLVVEQPTTTKVRDAQDLSLVISQPTTTKVRVSQDLSLVVIKRIWFGSEATTLPHLTAAGVSTSQDHFTGTAAVGLRSLSASASGTFQYWAATGAVTLRHITIDASGTSIDNFTGTAAITLRRVTPSASGSVGSAASYTSTAAVTLRHLTASGAGVLSETCTAAVTLKHITVAASGMPTSAGNVTLKHLTLSGTAALVYSGTAAISLKHVVPAGIGTAFFTYGSAAVTLRHLTASGAGAIIGPSNVVHNLYWKYKADDLKVAWIQTYKGSRQIEISRRVPSGAMNQSFGVVLTEATTVALSLYASQNVTLTVNAQTFNLVKQQALVWTEDSLADYPFDADVSTILVSNFAASSANFIVSALVLDDRI